MITERNLLISVVFAIAFTVAMALIHSLAVFFYASAVLNLVFGIYWSFLAYIYKKQRLQVNLLLQQSLKKEGELSNGWWAGWPTIVAAIMLCVWGFNEQFPPLLSGSIPVDVQAAISGVGGFVAGFGYPMMAWWLWQKYVAAVNHLT
ncbi:MAG: hypothetical protein ABI234_11330 [Ktedonobacteraceae bacterium]